MSRDRAHMAAIGREGGHSRGQRARAAAAATVAGAAAIGAVAGAAAMAARDRHSHDVDYSSNAQPYVRHSNEERTSFDTGRRSTEGGFGAQDRSSNRSGDNSNEGGPLSNRDRERI